MPTLFLSDLFPAINRNHHLVYFHSRLKGKRAERKGKKGKEKKKKKKSFLETGYSRKATPTVDPPLTHTQASAMNTFFSFSFFLSLFFLSFHLSFLLAFLSFFAWRLIYPVRACVRDHHIPLSRRRRQQIASWPLSASRRSSVSTTRV